MTRFTEILVIGTTIVFTDAYGNVRAEGRIKAELYSNIVLSSGGFGAMLPQFRAEMEKAIDVQLGKGGGGTGVLAPLCDFCQDGDATHDTANGNYCDACAARIHQINELYEHYDDPETDRRHSDAALKALAQAMPNWSGAKVMLQERKPLPFAFLAEQAERRAQGEAVISESAKQGHVTRKMQTLQAESRAVGRVNGRTVRLHAASAPTERKNKPDITGLELPL